VLGWSWGGLLAVSYALTGAEGVRSLILASPVVDMPLWEAEARRLRDELPGPTVRALRRHEDRLQRPATTDSGTARRGFTAEDIDRRARTMRRVMPLLTSKPVQRAALLASHVPALRRANHQVLTLQYVLRYVMRKPDPAIFTMMAGTNDRLYAHMWGPAEYPCTGTLSNVDLTPRLAELTVPVLVLSGRHDEATPSQMQAIVDGARNARWIVLEGSAHCGILEESERFAAEIDAFLEATETNLRSPPC
jgi:pimeloyl-ACP methyl ester carboxylesterase